MELLVICCFLSSMIKVLSNVHTFAGFMLSDLSTKIKSRFSLVLNSFATFLLILPFITNFHYYAVNYKIIGLAYRIHLSHRWCNASNVLCT